MQPQHWVQPLEPRVLLALISWDGGGDGIHWDDPNNWSSNQVPTINDDVTIDVPAADPTITIRTSAAVRNLTTRETIYLSYPGQFIEFRVAQDVNLFADFRIENLATGGTWNGPGRIVILNNAALLNQPGTINCDIVFDDPGTTFSIQGNLVFNGTMVLGTAGSNLSDQVFLSGEGARSITGTGTFIFRGNDPIFSSAICNNTVNPPNALTIGPDITLIVEGTGRIQNNYFGCSTIFNGTIDVTTPGSVFTINQRVINQGTVRVGNGGVFGLFLDDQSVIGSIDLQSGGGVVLQSGRQVLGDLFTFDINSPITVPEGAALALSGRFNLNADLDINGDLILEYGGSSHLNLARQRLTSGYAAGAWNGPGIRSSRAAAEPGFALGYGESSEILGPSGGTFGSFVVDGSAVLVRSTRYGDANLDGNVNLSDFNIVAANFGQSGVSAWNRGDYNFDQRVDLADFNLLAGQFGQTASVAEDREGDVSSLLG